MTAATRPCELCGGTVPAGNRDMLGIDSRPPRSPVEFRLSVGAESRERLALLLEEFAERIRHGADHYHPITPRSLWGGAGSHGHHELDVDESITPDDYKDALRAWESTQRPGTP